MRQLHDTGRPQAVHRLQELKADLAVRHKQHGMPLASLQHIEPDDSDCGLS